MDDIICDKRRITVQFKSETGESVGPTIDLPIDVTVEQLLKICKALLQQDENALYSFYVKNSEITKSLELTLKDKNYEIENVLDIIYQPQAVFRVRAVTRCTSSIPGHAESVLSAQFSPDGRYLASGSGDTTVRFWDVNTETPHFKCEGHRHHVLVVSWSPDGQRLASGCKNGKVIIWNPETGRQIGPILNGHKLYITALSWEPLHRNPECRKLASASKDATVRIWDTFLCQTLICLTTHTNSVTSLKWSGSGLIYTGSRDRTICVWRAEDGVLCRILKNHGHWVTTLALSNDYVLRTGAFDPSQATINYREITDTREEIAAKALKRYEAVSKEPELLVSGSDDHTLTLWNPSIDKNPIIKMTGHQNAVNDVKFSPDTRIIASASFDKSIKLWDGKTGKFLVALRGHVQEVYQISWSADSRLLVSGSADSTLKLWDIKTKKLAIDLPGHADQIFAIDWSPDGQRVVSGGRDKIIKIWRK